ncbi:beta-lactamase family protein [Streptomyces sp. NBC_01571]|uniref:serine hydrolase domain-containing protein n=1 Tax=Streptomyces sp. NBC_01571 TaxID=2975883 RepID=UPI002253C562|nr:serine hydrolase domain-containing protein [Streptomyces sp. NBC_01571]MCX4576960.1 beta-lactamase family protein [Streptomyces sp. NBC_01571]
MPPRRTPRTLLVIPLSLTLVVLASAGLFGLNPSFSPSFVSLASVGPSGPTPPRPGGSRTVPPSAPTDSPPPAPPEPKASRARGSSTPFTSYPLVSVAPAGSPTSVSRATGAALVRLVTRGGAPAAALLSYDGTGSRFAGAGRGIARADHFRAGSVTKTLIATVVLQLAAEHRLSLSDSVDAHLPRLVRGAGNDGRRLTLRSLLTHTSGLYDFTADTGGTVPLTPLRAVHLALTHPPAARGRFAYSNTNYVLLGLVIHRVTGHSYATEAERRVIAPLRLTGTSFPGGLRSLPSPHGRSYAADGRDVTELDPRVAGAAGELVTTLADLNRFYAALLGGELLPPHQLREMLNTRTAQGVYGMGLYPVKLACGITVWGHNGRISGSYVRTAADVDGRHVLTFRVNTDKIADPRLEPALLSAEFCPRTR